MAFARLFPIDAIDAQDGDRTSSELSLSDGTSCGTPHGPNDFGDLPPLAVLKQYADGVAISREDPPLAKIRHGSPPTAIGPRTAEETSVTAIAIWRHRRWRCQAFRPSVGLELFERGMDQGDCLNVFGPRGYRSCVEGIFLDLAIEKREFCRLWQVPVH
jgi:hypothetical protein